MFMLDKIYESICKRLHQEYIKYSLNEQFGQELSEEELTQVAPPGMENLVMKLKKDPNVANPWATAWSIYNKKKAKKK